MSNPHVHRFPPLLLHTGLLHYCFIATVIGRMSTCTVLSILISEINVEVVERVLNRSGCRVSGCGPVMVRGVQNYIHNI